MRPAFLIGMALILAGLLIVRRSPSSRPALFGFGTMLVGFLSLLVYVVVMVAKSWQ